jgi:hypothetical protein
MRFVRFAIVFVALMSLPSGISAIEQNPTRDPYGCMTCDTDATKFAECHEITQWGGHSSWSGCEQNTRICYTMPGGGTECYPSCGSRCSAI